MITVKHSGSFKRTEKFLKKMSRSDFRAALEAYGEAGVQALAEATPKDSGETAASWSYEIRPVENGVKIYWKNSNANDGVNVAILIQYGHGTRQGAYVEGIDYINPAIQPVIDKLSKAIWEEVTTA
jgi:hypothetical protein